MNLFTPMPHAPCPISPSRTIIAPFLLNPFLRFHPLVPTHFCDLSTPASFPTTMSQREQKSAVSAASAAVQQSDNIAHALAGAGGGILSMMLTYGFP
jgi:hypothetical protein